MGPLVSTLAVVAWLEMSSSSLEVVVTTSSSAIAVQGCHRPDRDVPQRRMDQGRRSLVL